MLLNTKQVRALGNAVAGFGAQYTDKTSEKNIKRRSVIWHFYNLEDADRLEAHLRANCTNKVTRTGVAGNMWTQAGGGEYVRVIADIA
jgi:hypothetical protein